jgi:thymidylate synthase
MAWRLLMERIMTNGRVVAPRGQPTLEVLHTSSISIEMSRPVVTTLERRLNYQFMCAEALWILSGDNQLAPLTRFVKRMAEFSDDGVTLSGAYGPPIVRQLDFVVNALRKDRDTRQAVLTTWRQAPAPSKDIPCTVSMAFSIRDGKLHQHVYMRSSDAWLGIPYDMFSFACVGIKVACAYNEALLSDMDATYVVPGALTITATSSHLYERNHSEVEKILLSAPADPIDPVPHDLVIGGRWATIAEDLFRQREGERGELWRVRP